MTDNPRAGRRAYLTEHLAVLASYGNAGDERAAAVRDELAALDDVDDVDQADTPRRARRGARTP